MCKYALPIHSFSPYNNPIIVVGYYCCPYFIDEEAEIQRGPEICLSHIPSKLWHHHLHVGRLTRTGLRVEIKGNFSLLVTFWFFFSVNLGILITQLKFLKNQKKSDWKKFTGYLMTYILFGGTCVLHIINMILSGASEHFIIVWSTVLWFLSSATGSLSFGPVDILGWMVLFFRGLSCSQLFSSVPDLCTYDVSSTRKPPSHHSQQCQWCHLGKRWRGRQNQSELRTTSLLSLPFRNLQESVCTYAKL